ncbi:MAG: hypothetical protein WCO97_03945 [bacterium]
MIDDGLCESFPVLLPGDVLLYSASSLLGYLVCVKTGSLFSHAEVAVSGHTTVGARLSGTDIYGVDMSGHLRCVRRPWKAINAIEALRAVADDVGKPYPLGEFFYFFDPWLKHRYILRFCSVIVAHFLTAGGVCLFNPAQDLNLVTPDDLWKTPSLVTIWKR